MKKIEIFTFFKRIFVTSTFNLIFYSFTSTKRENMSLILWRNNLVDRFHLFRVVKFRIIRAQFP
jgi:hypothetical protein